LTLNEWFPVLKVKGKVKHGKIMLAEVFMVDTGFSLGIFMWVLIVIVGVVLAFMIVFAPIKLWTIDKTLKQILEELRKK